MKIAIYTKIFTVSAMVLSFLKGKRRKGRFRHAKSYADRLCDILLKLAGIIHYFEGFAGGISVNTLKLAYAICDMCADNYIEMFSVPPIVIKAARDMFDIIVRERGDHTYGPHCHVKKNWLRTESPHYIKSNTVLFEDAFQVLIDAKVIYYEQAYFPELQAKTSKTAQLWVDINPSKSLARSRGWGPRHHDFNEFLDI